MQQSQSKLPKKFGTDPHRAFQGLETIYIPENMIEKVNVGDKVNWDFEKEQLTVGENIIWNIPASRGRYYGCIDSYRHKVISWVAAKEGRKLKIFTSVDLKNSYGEILKPTESESIEKHISEILPRLRKTIGKGFWQFFDEQSNIPPKSIIRLLNRIAEIKVLANEIYLLDTLSEREQKINEIINKICQVNADEIPVIRDEIASHPKFNFENIEKDWREKLSENVWKNLEEDAKTFLKTGEIVYRFLDTLSIPNIDWASANVEFCKAIELELNRKIMNQFGQWLKNKNRDGLTTLISMFNWKYDRYEWKKFLLNSKKSKDAKTTLGTIRWIFQNLRELESDKSKNTPFEKKLLFLFDEFIDELGDSSRYFLKNLPDELDELIITRNGSLHTQFLEKEKVDKFVSKLERLLPEMNNFLKSY